MTTAPITTSLGFCIVPNYALADLEGPIDTLLVAGDMVMSTPCETGR
jgi:hypothetical protein